MPDDNLIAIYAPGKLCYKKDNEMARVCELTGKRRLVGNNVSHAKNKTKKQQQVNLHFKKVYDPETKQTIRLRLSAHAIRTLDKVGSLSKFLRKYGKKLLA